MTLPQQLITEPPSRPETELTAEQLGTIIDFLTEQIAGIELCYPSEHVFVNFHLRQLRNYRRVLNDKLLEVQP